MQMAMTYMFTLKIKVIFNKL